MKLLLGGQIRTLKFNFGTLKHIGDLTGNDPLLFSANLNNPGEQFQYVKLLVHAGMLSAREEFDAKDVDGWVQDMEGYDALQVIEAFKKAYEPKTAGQEASGDTHAASHV